MLVGALALERLAAADRDFDVASLRVTATGAVLPGPTAARSEETSVRALLDLLRRGTHRRLHHASATDEQLLHGLGQATGDPASAARELRSLLDLHGLDSGRLAGQLGALVRQARLGALPKDDADGVVPVRVPDHRPPDRVRRRAHRHRVVGAVVAACAVLLLTAGYFTVTGQAGPFLHRIFGTGGTTASVAGAGGGHHPTSHRSETARQPVHRTNHHHRFGPRSAGPVHRVSLQATGCTVGAACTTKVTVSMSAATAGETVRWRVGVVDRCVRRTTWSAPASVTAQPGWTTVYATSTVTLPRTHRAALVARTTGPARAASQLVPLPGGHC